MGAVGTAKRLAARAVRRTSQAADRVLPRRNGLVVLIYHQVGGGTDSAVDLSPDRFRAQMEHLREHHRVWAIDDAVAELAADRHPEGVVITFDDGAADFAEHAVPVMADLGLPSTLYLVTSAPTNGTLPWGVPSMSWAAVRDVAADGLVTVGSHTHDHRLLHRAAPALAAAQLDRSVAAIADALGAPPQHFAYPKAVPGSAAARAAVAARFRSAALAGHRVNTGPQHLQRLGRVPITRGDDMASFAAKVAGGLRLEGLARHAVARVRYRHRET